MMPVATAPIPSMHYVKKIAANVPMNQIGIILSVDVFISVRVMKEPHLMMPMLSAKLEECVIWSCVGGAYISNGRNFLVSDFLSDFSCRCYYSLFLEDIRRIIFRNVLLRK